MSGARKKNGRFKVGDWVAFPYGNKDPIAQVIEARGPLGINQRHLYRILVPRESGEPDSFEMPEDELAAAAPLGKAAIMDYLKAGGLVEILRSNLSGGRDQPKVWLSYTPRGKISHTFLAERGMIGGATVPFFALHEGSVSAGKADEVVRFLESFGLNRAEAQEILTAIGTAP
jgi:hypothetical protein